MELDQLLTDEGFESKPYQDHLGVWTIGHGLTYLTEEESRFIVQGRVFKLRSRLIEEYEWLSDAPADIIDVLTNMAYQMGMGGLSKFRKTLAYLEEGQYRLASVEMLDSRWAEQTPNRAKRIAARVYACGEV